MIPASLRCSCGSSMTLNKVHGSISPIKTCSKCDVPDQALTLASLGFYDVGDLDVPDA